METRFPTDETQPEVRDLDARGVLDDLVRQRRTADAAEARSLALAVHWVDLHPAPADTEDIEAYGPLARFADLSLGGQGTPTVCELAVEELAAALDLSHAAALSLVGDAVELCFRLPRLWALVQDGSLQAWKARQVARKTPDLSREAVAWLDAQLAVTARHNRVPALNPVVHEARLRCDPDQALAVEETALARRGVWLDHRESTATTQVTARLDTLDALDLDATLGDLASLLRTLGDPDALDVRRSRALGMLAHPQRVLDLAAAFTAGTQAEAGSHVETGSDVETGSHVEAGSHIGQSGRSASDRATAGGKPRPALPRPDRWLNGSRATVYLHIDLAEVLFQSIGGTGVGSVERLGTASLSLLQDWLQRASQVRVQSVRDGRNLDGARDDPPP